MDFLSDDELLLVLSIQAFVINCCKQQLMSPQEISSADQSFTVLLVIYWEDTFLLSDKSPSLTVSFDSINNLLTRKYIPCQVVDENEVSFNLCAIENRNPKPTEAEMIIIAGVFACVTLMQTLLSGIFVSLPLGPPISIKLH